MRFALIFAVAAVGLAGCASTATSTPPPSSAPTPTVTGTTITALELCSNRIDVLSSAASVLNLDAPTAAQLKDVSIQMTEVAKVAPAPFGAQFTALAVMFGKSSIETADFKKSAQAILDGCSAVLASAKADAAPAASPNTIEEGTWTVGVDVKPGTYRTVDPVAGGCYWEITKAGTNGADIVENDNPTGGRPTVTLKKGQEFKNQGCGTFKKV